MSSPSALPPSAAAAVVTAASAFSPPPSNLRKAWLFYLKHPLPISIIVLITIGSLWTTPGRALDSALPVATIATFIIFFLQGLQLETEEAKDALRSWRATAYGFTFILLLSPFLAFGLFLIPLDPSDLTVGLALFVTMPTASSTSVVFTKEAYGNTALALLLCAGTTLLSIPIMPFTIPFFALRGGSAGFDTASFLLNLCVTILLPIAVGKLCKECVPPLTTVGVRHSNAMKYVMAACVCLLPWIQVSKSSSEIGALSFSALALTTLQASALHLILLGINVLVVRYLSGLLQLDIPKQRAIVMCCSEKTLPVALTILSLLPYSDERRGVLVVAIIIAHLAQIIMDGILASWWRSKTDDDRKRRTDGTADAVYIPAVERQPIVKAEVSAAPACSSWEG